MTRDVYKRCAALLPRPGAWDHRATRDVLAVLLALTGETADEVAERVEKGELWKGIDISDETLMLCAGIRKRATFEGALCEAVRRGFLAVIEWSAARGTYRILISAILRRCEDA